MQRNEVLFDLDAVAVEAGGRRILGEISGSIFEGRITVVAGPSGAGKTTFLRLLNRLDVPSEGKILFKKEDLASLDPLIHRRRVGMVFQKPVLFGGGVRDNLRIAVPDLSDEAAKAALERAGLAPGFLEAEAADLSGGEAQRMCIARALVMNPAVLLLDEPTSALDAAPRLELEGLARELTGSGVTLIWVTHDLAQMERIAADVVILVAGISEYWGGLGGLASADSAQARAFLAGFDSGS